MPEVQTLPSVSVFCWRDRELLSSSMMSVRSRSPEQEWLKPFYEQQAGQSQAQDLVAVGNGWHL